jgi:hypothetical protein
MNRQLVEKSMVVLLFVFVLVLFSLAPRDTQKVKELYTGTEKSTQKISSLLTGK